MSALESIEPRQAITVLFPEAASTISSVQLKPDQPKEITTLTFHD
jgi:hypothetical protein